MTDTDRALCRVTACWLAACARGVGALGLGAGLAGLAGLLLPAAADPLATAAFSATVVLTLAERWFATRLTFDAALFVDLASSTAGWPDGQHATRHALDMLDVTLSQLGLRPVPERPRGLADRVAGARRLCRLHAGVVLCQCVTLATALAASRAAIG